MAFSLSRIDDASRQNTVLNCSFDREENAEQGKTVGDFFHVLFNFLVEMCL